MSVWGHLADSPNVKYSTTSAVAVAYPGSPSATNTIFLVAALGNAGGSFTVSDAGFTLFHALQTGNGTLGVWWKVATGSETGTFTVTCTDAHTAFYQTSLFNGGPADAISFAAAIITPVIRGGTSGSGIIYNALSLGGNANCLVLAAGEKFVNGTSITAPSDFPNIIGQNNSTNPGCMIWSYNIQTTATDIGAGSFTIGTGDSSTSNQTILVAIKPGAGSAVGANSAMMMAGMSR